MRFFPHHLFTAFIQHRLAELVTNRESSRNVSEALAGPRQTNQRAELTGIQRALDIAPIDRDVMIYSDSSYSINCVTVWFQNWRKNDWKNASKKPVENKDLIEAILNRIEERNLDRKSVV